MSILITYPRHKVSPHLRTRLAEAGAVLYLPLRLLQAVDVTPQQQQNILRSDTVILTSAFGLSVFLDRYAIDWMTAQGDAATLVVLSRKMADRAMAAGIQQVLVPNEEHRVGVLRLLNSLPAALPDGRPRHMMELTGNLHVATSATTNDAATTNINAIQIYENTWPKDANRHAFEELQAFVGKHGPIDRVLVASPSAWTRLQSLRRQWPKGFAPSILLVTLGPSTAAAIRHDGECARKPNIATCVLDQAVAMLCDDDGDRTAIQ